MVHCLTPVVWHFHIFVTEGEWHVPVSLIVFVYTGLHYLQKLPIFAAQADFIILPCGSEDIAVRTLLLLGKTPLDS